MPTVFLARLPVPSFRVYTVISVAIWSCSVYYAAQIVKDPGWHSNNTPITLSDQNNNGTESGNGSNDSRTPGMHLKELLACMIQEPVCFWPLMNIAYCALILLGKTIQKFVFGELRASERQHLKDKFGNFIFYKFIFVFGVLNVQYADEIVLWWAWFTALGFLGLLSQLCKDRFVYLSFSPTTPGWSHARLLGLLAAILALSLFMLLISTAAALFFVSFNTYAFMAAECILLSVRTTHVMLRYAIHLYDTRSSPRSSDKRGPLAYYTELICELTVLAVDFLHHVHMLLWSNILLSMASLVICMQLRFLFHEIQRRITKHRNYLAVLNHMEKNYPMAAPEELAENCDNCAICWEKMDSARKLPCSHLFHNSCLQSWLEQDTSCPTCRLTLSMQANRRDSTVELRVESPESQTSVGRNDNHFFHFDGSRYVSWLPSFSVEVTHNRLRGDILTLAHSNSQLDAMARQVLQLFPHYPRNVVLEDLRITRSVELTVENILDGRLTLPHHVIGEIEPETSTQTQTSSNHILPSPVTSKTWDPKFDVPVVDRLSPSNDIIQIVENQTEEPSTVGGRFSKCSSERERILHRRKEHMLLTARRKYLEKHRKSEVESTSSGICSDNSIESRS
ncbi:E3 ubiquitin-protein ligase AMFR-like isoform X1 [Cotesia glomerata]|uniref:E3 ubiquitin-protein ligase AMFR n=1 Tax=Cotesia glomerata TaxID=32391 RepID=A0AAV7I1F0_COTGL|nr:E3 ubiquitin-protein ligase AMFR-like isoform X1 [Cotesia glomerata]XP_044576097.1 E3 ubiquitin-protein ligase AMFR-like isoform X1 [Cotesia glomerata]KAH0539644.1 hypothetical protein KQX54_006567 [Cotesia glomerata]